MLDTVKSMPLEELKQACGNKDQSFIDDVVSLTINF